MVKALFSRSHQADVIAMLIMYGILNRAAEIMPISDDNNREGERLNLLRRELRLAGIDVRRFFPRWAQSRLNREHILKELLIALEAPVHEGLIPPYGTLIVPNASDLSPLLSITADNLRLARQAANGNAVIAWEREAFRGLLLQPSSNTPDLQLIRIVRPIQGVAICRDGSGVVRLYGPSMNLKHMVRRWSVSPAISDAIDRVQIAAPMVDRNLLTAFLDFANHVLSPRGIGATLIWVLSDRVSGGMPIDLRPLGLKIAPDFGGPSLSFIAHILAQHDGATYISREGMFLGTGVLLTPTSRAQEFIHRCPGMRHTSAKRASFDQADTLIITVSVDGPVTIFSDGVSVFELKWYSAFDHADMMMRAHRENLEDTVWPETRERTCARCGKTSIIEILTVAGYRYPEEAHCPICGEVIDSALCHQMGAHIVKVF